MNNLKIQIRFIPLLLLFISIDLTAQNHDTVVVNINNITLPLTNDGNIGGVDRGAYFDSVVFLFSAGHFLSGINSDTIWSNGMLVSDRLQNYLPGKVNGDTSDTRNKFFTVKSADVPFGPFWDDWKDAVDMGAYFYDGDMNGVYEAIDLNGNGEWDENEDRPDLIGDITFWDVFHDATPSFKDVQSMGIEIRRTVFAYYEPDNEIINNTIFFRYVIENVGENNLLDSVYLGIVADNDIGNYGTDLTGCDTILQSTFAYKNQPDDYYGNDPPALFVSLLQGPVVSNQLNQASVIRRGPFLGEEILENSINLEMTSSLLYYRYGIPPPDNKKEMRNYLLGGLFANGDSISVRDLESGNGDLLGSEADLIPPWYMFSGDPETNEGWLNISPQDWRMINSTGPFQLEKGKPVEIIFAFVIGRGTDPLNSVTVGKEYVAEIRKFYESNFTALPVEVSDDIYEIVNEFNLYQNYPNPFNPITKLEYRIPSNVKGEMSKVSLIVYDVLGREVATLVNKEQSAGSYEVQFDASNLTSGIYFYKLQSGSFVESRKMVLLR